MPVTRQVSEGRQELGSNEEKVWGIDVTNWGSSPSSPDMVVWDLSDENEDVSADVLSGSMTVDGNVVYLKKIASLTAGSNYRAWVKFTVGSDVLEAYLDIICTAGAVYA